MLLKVFVDPDLFAVHVDTAVHVKPRCVLVCLFSDVELLENDNVCYDLSTGVLYKRIIRQPQRTYELKAIRKIVSCFGVCRIEEPVCNDHRHNAAGTEVFSCFCYYEVVYLHASKFFVFLALAGQRHGSERWIAYRKVKDAVSEWRILESR